MGDLVALFFLLFCVHFCAALGAVIALPILFIVTNAAQKELLIVRFGAQSFPMHHGRNVGGFYIIDDR